MPILEGVKDLLIGWVSLILGLSVMFCTYLILGTPKVIRGGGLFEHQ